MNTNTPTPLTETAERVAALKAALAKARESTQEIGFQRGENGAAYRGDVEFNIAAWQSVSDALAAIEAHVAAAEKALREIKGGMINTDFVVSDPPDWHRAFNDLQAIARAYFEGRHAD